MLVLGFLFVSYITLLVCLFLFSDTKTDLERFIDSKHVSNAADVEHWVRQYERRQGF